MGGTVTVACKLPNGLHIENRTADASSPSGYGAPARVTLVGSEHRRDEMGNPIHAWEMSNTFGLTPNVDADFFDQWMKENAESPLVKNRIVFAHGKDTRGMTAEFKDVKTGLEGLDPKAPGPGIEPMTDKPS
jgi:hypothetical protein